MNGYPQAQRPGPDGATEKPDEYVDSIRFQTSVLRNLSPMLLLIVRRFRSDIGSFTLISAW